MAARALLLGVAGFAAVFSVGCNPYGGGAFSCTTDPECGASGLCHNGYCGFPDSSCTSGYRYGNLAGPDSNVCFGQEQADAGVGSDGRPIDAPFVFDGGGSCYGMGLVTACFASPPSGAVALSAPINTDTSPLCASAVTVNTPACVIAGSDITATGTVNVIGSKPLVLVATGTITVTGTIDAASHRAGGQIGAGAVPSNNTTLCDPGTNPGNNGGGAGGSFGTAGANGGGGNGGSAGAQEPATALRGGCAGQDGRSGTPGTKGQGGGAVYLIAQTSITVNGAINASGGGGNAGVINNAGGGGGGAGGLIGLDSPSVTANGPVFANGGGGAEGSGNSTKGNDGQESNNGAAAPGSGNASNGGDGGGGGATGANPGTGGTTANGGGGGGGSVGAIKLFRAASIGGAGTVSPTPS